MKYLVTYIAKDATRRKRLVDAETVELAAKATIEELKVTTEPHVLKIVNVIPESS